MSSAIYPGVKKIAILRANAVGDFVVALPALEALRSTYPQAEIVLLGRHWHSAFLAERPGPVDRTIVVPYSSGIYDPPGSARIDQHELKRFFEDMTSEQFDLAFQLHGGGKNSNAFIRNLGARVTIGARTPEALPLDRSIRYRTLQNEMLRLLEIVSLAGARPVTVEPRLNVIDGDLREAEEVVPENGRPIVVISPGCRDPRRRWPPQKFAAVADLLAGRGARIIVNGDEGDLAPVRETLACMQRDGQSVCGVLSLRGLAGMLARASLLVSNDSGPLHLAYAIGTPCVGVYWFGNMLTYGPVGSRRTAVHISWRLHCPVCGTDCVQSGCPHRDSFVSDVPVKEVAESALELFKEGPVKA